MIIMALVCLALVCAFWLVIHYNRLVNLQHGVSDLETSVHATQIANAELNDKIFGIFTTGNIDAFAVSHHLEKDRAPRYLQVSVKWPPDSQY